MPESRFSTIARIFEDARLLQGAARMAFVREATDGSDELRAEVLELLAYHEASDPVLPRDGMQGASGMSPLPDLLVKGETVGAYRVENLIGRGGMGSVYRASPLPAGPAPVALKLLHPHLGRDPDYRARFLREAAIGQRVKHPNVVQTLDAGLAEGAHYLAMELVEGQTLSALAEDLGRVPEALCRHIAGEVCAGLAAIHGTGAVHRDLKPSNILITADEVVKIMDLGVALALDNTRLSQTGHFVGTVSYGAPEQFAPDLELDGRVDLYALGLVLYELATGCHPFGTGTLKEIITRQLAATPRPAGELNPQLSPFFDELLATLLQKSRDDRFANAEALRSVLVEGEASAWWEARAHAIRERTRQPLRRMRVARETVLIGRGAELKLLDDVFHRAREGQGGVILLEGEAGIGKTRLVDEFVARQREADVRIQFLFGGHPAGSSGTAAEALRQALAAHFGGDQLDVLLSSHLPRAPLLVPAFAAFLRGEPPPESAVPLTQDTLEAAFVQILRSLAQEHPTVLLVDDLHFASSGGRGLFGALAQALGEDRLLLIGTLRPGVSVEWKAELVRLPQVRSMELPRLGARDLAALLAESLGSRALAEELALPIASKSDGNPFFAFEILRGLREARSIESSGDGRWVKSASLREVVVPSSVTDLIRSRTSDLSESDRHILEVAACCGFEFDPLLPGAVLGLGRIPVLQRLASLEQKSRLVRSVGRRFVFDHHQICEALYAGLPESLREAYHAALADALEAGSSPDEDAVEICRHALLGGQVEQGLRVLDRALEQVSATHRGEVGLDLLRRALEAPGLSSVRRLRLLNQQAGLLGDFGDRAGEGAAARAAVALAQEVGDDHLAMVSWRRLGWHLYALASYDESRAAFAETLACARATGDPRLEAASFGDVGGIGNDDGRFEEARRTYAEQARLADAVGDESTHWDARANMGLSLQYLGRYAEALEVLEQAALWYREHGGVAVNGILKINRGRLRALLGDPEKGLEELEGALSMLRSVGQRRPEGYALHRMGAVHQQLGHTREADDWYRAALALRKETNYGAGILMTLLAWGRCQWEFGDRGAALPLFEEAHARAEQLDSVRGRVLVGCCRARAGVEDPARARDLLKANDVRLRAAERLEAWFTLWQVEGRASDLSRASDGLQGLLAHAPEDVRSDMIARVPLHQAIYEAANLSLPSSGGPVS